MYPGRHASARANQPAFIMAGSGEAVTYAELEARSNALAHLLRAQGLKRLDHYAIFMENNARYVETCAAGERAGLYYTCVNSYLTAEELAYILQNSESKVLITSAERQEVALAALEQCPAIALCLVVNGTNSAGRVRGYEQAVAAFPTTPIADESLGNAMLYSSGTTGRPKGILRPLPLCPPAEALPGYRFIAAIWRFEEGLTYLSPAPLYHAAPHIGVNLTIRHGGTAIIMESFDAEQALALVERYRVTHAQYVPTMLSRMLKLPESSRRRYDLSSLRVAIHAAAPCPMRVKQAMIDWWGPILLEYYGMTESMGITICDSAEWLAHKGTVGRTVFGEIHILDPGMNDCKTGEIGEVWFKLGSQFSYFNDPERTKQALSPDGAMGTAGDVGYLDDDGYLYLTDRASFMIISGGVNIYPQETEDLLISHPKVADAAVFGVPNEDLGEEVKAVVQLMPEVALGPDIEAELIAYCREHLARHKVPRSVDFDPRLPRLPTGKLYKRLLRDRYWQGHASRIL
jgi:long-chain acyl-CoA synthetase